MHAYGGVQGVFSFLLSFFGACDNLHIAFIYVHTKGSCWQMDGMVIFKFVHFT